MKAKSRVAVAAVAALAALGSGCLVQVTHVSDPGAAFGRARAEAQRFEGRQGPAHELNLLAWEPDERKMVRVSVPLWLIHEAGDHVDWDDVDVEDGHGRWKKCVRRLRWEDIERAGPGILLEVQEDEGDRVLVWLR
jgi:hypothetical protein